MSPLEKELEASLLELYERWKSYGPPKNYFLQMVRKGRNVRIYKGPVGTVRYLLQREPSDGFKSLVRAGKKDLTVEALILDKKWQSLFEDWEVKKARARIDEAR